MGLQTIGSELNYVKFELSNGELVKCTFIDINGVPKFRSTFESEYKKANGFILVFDITDKNSFNDMRDYFIPKIKEHCPEDIPVWILGNKSDLEDSREVSSYEVNDLNLPYNYIYRETSCIYKDYLKDIFEDIIVGVKNYIENQNNQIVKSETFTIRRHNHRRNNNNRGCRGCC